LEHLRQRFHEQGLEVINLRISRDKSEEEAREAKARLQSEYSSAQSRVGDIESQLRKTRGDFEEMRNKNEYLERECQQMKRDIEAE
jgi:peptidoglycan hydrolase CwlO-like protein